MANITFGLNIGKKEVENKEHSIYIRYRYGRKVDFKKAIGFKILSKHWNSKTQSVKNRTEIKNLRKIKDLVKNLKRHFEDFEDELISKGKQPTLKRAKEAYQNFLEIPEESKETSKPNTLLKYFDFFINNRQTELSLSAQTIKSYKLTQKSLRKFNDKVYNIDFDNIDMEFYNDYKEWNEDQNYSINYIGKHFKNLKALLNNATEKGFNTNLKYQSKSFKVLRENVENIYLNLDELKKIYKFDLSLHPKLEQARDLFLIGAYTGLRVSDFNNLNKENLFDFEGRTFLKLETRKNPKKLIIPLRPEVKTILKKYGNKPPTRMPEQQINYKIKEVCENAGIDGIINTKRNIGGKKVITKKFKFDLVKTHTARRSFCTNAYLEGMETLDIMQISGHTSEKNFHNYIKASALEKAVKISSHPFFQGE
ncbi:MAG: site-specific integrase [Polaribacter sp.]|uniref:phage integrase SAM-like domain-containing protein n=1 Tax=Polaribacter sp. TaxID=1920175 RepID=UPI003BAEF33B